MIGKLALVGVLAAGGCGVAAAGSVVTLSPPAAAVCGAPSTGTFAGVTLDAEQLANAQIIASRGTKVGPAGITVAITAAYTESTLHNVPGGDASSVGLFQQQASWGTAAQRTNAPMAADWFYGQLGAIANWGTMAPGDAAQAVERSAYPGRYAPNVPMAQALTAALVGSCASAGGTAAGQAVIAAAQQALGARYLWGGTTLAGLDCSGLVFWSYNHAGQKIPRLTAAGYQQVATPVLAGQQQPGDLVFSEPNGAGQAGHVGLVLNTTTGIFAPHAGTVVQYQPLAGRDTLGYGRLS